MLPFSDAMKKHGKQFKPKGGHGPMAPLNMLLLVIDPWEDITHFMYVNSLCTYLSEFSEAVLLTQNDLP